MQRQSFNVWVLLSFALTASGTRSTMKGFEPSMAKRRKAIGLTRNKQSIELGQHNRTSHKRPNQPTAKDSLRLGFVIRIEWPALLTFPSVLGFFLRNDTLADFE